MASALRLGIGVGLAAVLFGVGSAEAATLTLARTRTSPAPAPAPAPVVSPTAPANPILANAAVLTASFYGPQLVVYGRRAVLYWRAGSDLVLSVAYGPTSALGSAAVEVQRADLTGVSREVTLELHQVALNDLALDSGYYYRGTLTRNGVVVGDTGTHPFRTPLAFARVRPVEIEMHKDGDHDLEVSALGQELYDNDNEGEVYLEWNVKLKPAPGDFAFGPKEKGCYPGGASIPTSFPEHEPDVSDPQPPDAGDGPDDWQQTGACLAYSYSNPVEVNTAKVGSGDVVELDPDAFPTLEWDLGEEIAAAGGSIAQAIAPDQDGDGEPDWTPSGESDPDAEPESPCGSGADASHALLRFGVRGQELDTAPGIGTELSSLAELTTVINHDVSEAQILCLDLRDEEQTYRVGVRAGSGSFEFTTWFDVTLDYRMAGE